MDALFLKLLNMSITASWLIIAVVVLRIALKKAPKWMSCILWAFVGIRLLPFSFESIFSLIPSTETFSQGIVYSQTPGIISGIPPLNNAVNPIISGSFAPGVGESVNPLQIFTTVVSYVWLLGVVAMLIYATVSYFKIRRIVKASIRTNQGIWICDDIKTPFIMGFINPHIYLPSGMEDATTAHVIAHENAHLKRRDHWWKPLGFLLLAVYWFNPLCWIAYILLCRDIELACDEKVIRTMEREEMVAYSEALYSCSVPRHMVMACPLAFGEVGVKERIKTVMNYKKPAFWVIVIAVVACIVVAVCFLTNPKSYAQEIRANGDIYTQSGETITVLPQGSTELGILNSTNHRTSEHPTEDFTGANLNKKYPGNMLYQSGTEADVIYLEDLSGFYIPFVREANNVLTLDDVITLSVKGEKLTWSDFDIYAYNETGFGLYIRVYEIDERFSLWIGGGPTDEPPMYIRLVSEANQDDYIDIRRSDVRAFVKEHDGTYHTDAVTETVVDTLDDAVSAAILAQNRNAYHESDFACESHVTLATVSATPEVEQTTHEVIVYAMVLHQEYDFSDGIFNEVSGSHIPTALTFDVDKKGDYTLTEYWIPRDGSYYWDDIRHKFPSSIQDDDLDTQKYILAQVQNCYAQAVEYGKVDTNAIIEELFESICSSPTSSSNTLDHMDAHPIEYRELTWYGDYTLRYIFGEFLRGGQTDLRGNMMRSVMDDLIGGEALKLEASNGQKYFDAWRAHTEKIHKQNEDVYMQKNCPKGWLLLQMIG